MTRPLSHENSARSPLKPRKLGSMTRNPPSSTQDDYADMKAYGHSPAKAAEIMLDAKRGDFFCERYIAFVRGAAAKARGEA